jgi:hypothetical protein
MKVTKSKKVMFSVAVAFVSVFFFAYAIAAFYPAPQYEDFCDNVNYKFDLNNFSECEGLNGKWIDEGGVYLRDAEGYCDVNYFCNEEYQEARKPYERNVFFANVILGIALFVVAFFLALESVSSGLMGGAVMLIVYGSLRYWGELSDVWRTLMLGIALGILIWLGYRKLKE